MRGVARRSWSWSGGIAGRSSRERCFRGMQRSQLWPLAVRHAAPFVGQRFLFEAGSHAGERRLLEPFGEQRDSARCPLLLSLALGVAVSPGMVRDPRGRRRRAVGGR